MDMDILHGYNTKNDLFSLYRTRFTFLFPASVASLRTQQAKLASVASAQRLADSKAPSNNEIMAQMDVACVN